MKRVTGARSCTKENNPWCKNGTSEIVDNRSHWCTLVHSLVQSLAPIIKVEDRVGEGMESTRTEKREKNCRLLVQHLAPRQVFA